jgi:FlgD Ig-like domain
MRLKRAPLQRGLSLCCIALAMATTTDARATSFTVETVDSLGRVGTWTSIAVDPSCQPHISYRYYEAPQADLRYARRIFGSWSTETVDGDAGSDGYCTSIAFKTDDVAISYQGSNAIWYALRDGPAWNVSFVGMSNAFEGSTHLSFDASGNTHVVYAAVNVGEGFGLWHAKEAGGPFERNPIAVGPDNYFGAAPSAAIEEDGTPHVSCADIAQGTCSYVTKHSGAWVIEAFEGSGGASAIALDSMNRPHVGYQGGENGHLRYAAKLAGDWTVEAIDPTANQGYWLSLTVDQADNPHVCYYDGVAGDLKYASKISGAWSVQVIDNGGDVGWDCDIAIDAKGLVHMSYYDETKKDLKYAVSQTPTAVAAGSRPAVQLMLWPNPAIDGRVWLALGSSTSGRDVQIYDIAGRHVASVVLPIGSGPAEWDGRDDAGRPVGAGTYLFRLDGGGGAQRLTLIR